MRFRISNTLFRCLLPILLLLPLYAPAQKSDSLFQRLKLDLQMEREANRGRIIWDAETTETYYLLLCNTPTEEMVAYTSDSIPEVRAKIFAGLTQKGTAEKTLRRILALHQEDTAHFTTSGGCVTMDWTVIDYMNISFSAKPKKPADRIDFRSRLQAIQESTKSHPHILIAGVKHGLIAKENLLKGLPFTYSEPGFKILSFTLSTEAETFKSSNTSTPEMEEFIQNLPSGTRLFIEDLRIKIPDGTTRRVNPFILMLQ